MALEQAGRRAPPAPISLDLCDLGGHFDHQR